VRKLKLCPVEYIKSNQTILFHYNLKLHNKIESPYFAYFDEIWRPKGLYKVINAVGLQGGNKGPKYRQNSTSFKPEFEMYILA